MRRIVSVATAVLACVTFAACTPPAPSGTAPPAPLVAGEQTAATEAVRSLYAAYQNPVAGPNGPEADWSSYRSAALQARFAALPAKQLASDEPILDFDPIVGAQDWAISDLSFSEAAGATATSRTVTATFKNYGEPRVVTFDVVEEGGAWKVDNVRTSGPGAYDIASIFKGVGL